MTRNTNILNELKEISPAVANIGTQNPYSLPAGYFETLPEVILSKISAGVNDESAVLGVAGKKMPLSVPEDYFMNLSSSILEKIKSSQDQSATDELNEQSALLAGISKNNVYKVPEGYFDSLSNHIAEKINPTGTAKVVSLFNRQVWMRYAAAAIFVSIIATGAWLISSKTNSLGSEIVAKGLKIKTDAQFEESLAQVNQADLLNYLKLTGDVKDSEAIELMVDETKLPEEADYMDDEFLESFMNDLEQTNSKNN